MNYDSHLHSINSRDGSSPVMTMCERAIALELSGIAFTDHVEIVNGTADALEVLRDRNTLTLRAVWQTVNVRLHIIVHSAVVKNSM